MAHLKILDLNNIKTNKFTSPVYFKAAEDVKDEILKGGRQVMVGLSLMEGM